MRYEDIVEIRKGLWSLISGIFLFGIGVLFLLIISPFVMLLEIGLMICEKETIMTEHSKLKREIISVLKKANFWLYSPYDIVHKGVPDILALSPGGKFYAIEIKIKDDKLKELQWRTLIRIAENGGNSLVVAKRVDINKTTSFEEHRIITTFVHRNINGGIRTDEIINCPVGLFEKCFYDIYNESA